MSNLYRWVDKGYLVKLRNGFYAFTESIKTTSDMMFISQLIYCPSYVSLQYALSFYGLIPEAVVSMTAVTTLKTYRFENSIGCFDYRTIGRHLFWGYKKYLLQDGKHSYAIAELEKAILDYLYLNPWYDTLDELSELRFDDYVMTELVDRGKLLAYADRFGVKSLNNRIELLLSLY